MDISVFAVFVICGIYGFWRWYDQRRHRSQHDVLRSRVAWMLWSAAQRVQVDAEPAFAPELSLPARR
jgi:hypothetical protein